MSNLDIIRAWKDEQYRHSLSAEEQRGLPANPAGEIELDNADLEQVNGGATAVVFTAGCCTRITQDLVSCISCALCGTVSQFFC